MIRRIHALGCTAALLFLSTAGAAAADASPGPGGAGIPERPEVDAVACATGEPWACRPGAQLVVTGTGLDGVRAVVLLGRRGVSDDQRVGAREAAPEELSVVLPRHLRAGRIKLVGRGGSTVPPRELKVLDTAAPTQADTEADPPGAAVVDGEAFPIAGKHDLGRSPTNGFGGPRNHRGQDMFAACGTPLVAVRAARVQAERFQSAAGNYVVLQDASGRSYAYMHMRDRALVAVGAAVAAGQTIGFVGLTGRTSGCHLHFELWTAPGWYAGGEAIDPRPELVRWDALG